MPELVFVPIISGGDLPKGNVRAEVLWYWRKDLHDQLMVSYPYIKKAYPNPCDVRKKLGLTKKVTLWMDSGGYQMLTGKTLNHHSVEEVLRYQECSDCDVSFTLDVPNNLSKTYFNAIRALELRNRKDMLLYATLQHLFDYSSAAHMAKKMDQYSFDGIGIGKLVPKKFSLLERAKIILGVARNTKKPLHALGFSGVDAPYLAALLGVSSFDSMTYLHAAINRQYIVPFLKGQNFNVGKIDLKKAWKRHMLKGEPPCFCPICSNISSLKHYSQKGSIPVAMLALHNLFAMLSEIRLINNALREDWFEELINLRCNVSPSLGKVVKFIRSYLNAKGETKH